MQLTPWRNLMGGVHAAQARRNDRVAWLSCSPGVLAAPSAVLAQAIWCRRSICLVRSRCWTGGGCCQHSTSKQVRAACALNRGSNSMWLQPHAGQICPEQRLLCCCAAWLHIYLCMPWLSRTLLSTGLPVQLLSTHTGWLRSSNHRRPGHLSCLLRVAPLTQAYRSGPAWWSRMKRLPASWSPSWLSQ